jgi:hypothetical protein
MIDMSMKGHIYNNCYIKKEYFTFIKNNTIGVQDKLASKWQPLMGMNTLI